MRRRCGVCNIDYPDDVSFADCPVCDKATVSLAGDPDTDYDTKARLLLARETDSNPEKRKQVLWRRRVLVSAGFRGALLDLLADSPVDLHTITSLTDNGCPPELVPKILF
jgi:hypothetical protein